MVVVVEKEEEGEAENFILGRNSILHSASTADLSTALSSLSVIVLHWLACFHYILHRC